MLEIQRAVSAAETRAIEMIAQERIKMEKIYSDLSRNGEDGDTQSPGQNVRFGNFEFLTVFFLNKYLRFLFKI
jgi:hypothetical protein